MLQGDKSSPFLSAFGLSFRISCQAMWSSPQCFFGAQMTELGSTFKDNFLIGVFSYAVGGWGSEEKKSAFNSNYAGKTDILQKSCTEWAERLELFLKLHSLLKLLGLFSVQTNRSVTVRSHECIYQFMNEMSEDFWIQLGWRLVKTLSSVLFPLLSHCLLFERWKHLYTLHFPSTVLWYKVSDKVNLC